MQRNLQDLGKGSFNKNVCNGSPHENYNAKIPYVGDIDPTTPGASRPRRA